MTLQQRLQNVALSHVHTAADLEKARIKRDALIREAHSQGMGYGWIAANTGLSRARIQQIVNA